jgi:threonyl-tRNA synthetase
LEHFEHDDLKQEVLLRIPDGEVSIYKQGDFEDLCRGPHVPKTKYLHNDKLIFNYKSKKFFPFFAKVTCN